MESENPEIASNTRSGDGSRVPLSLEVLKLASITK